MNSSKKLILNADDYGSCEAVNLAVEEVAATGILGGVSVLANGESWAQAVEFLRQHTEIAAGVHLNVVEGRPLSSSPETRILTNKDGLFYERNKLLRRWLRRPLAVSRAVEIEWRAQLDRLQEQGLRLTHADSHQHLHAFPYAYGRAVKLCREYGIPALRHPWARINWPLRRQSVLALQASLALSRIANRRTGLYHNDYFLGFERAAGYDLDAVLEDVQTLADGVTEMAFHPSRTDGLPYAQLHGNRERLALLTASLAADIRRLGIDLMTWSTVRT